MYFERDATAASECKPITFFPPTALRREVFSLLLEFRRSVLRDLRVTFCKLRDEIGRSIKTCWSAWSGTQIWIKSLAGKKNVRNLANIFLLEFSCNLWNVWQNVRFIFYSNFFGCFWDVNCIFSISRAHSCGAIRWMVSTKWPDDVW